MLYHRIIGAPSRRHHHAHIDAARATLRLDRDLATYATFVAELALWKRRWADAEEIVRDGLARARSRDMAQLRVWLCAKGLRAQADLAALARARRDADAVRTWLARARKLLAFIHAETSTGALTELAPFRALLAPDFRFVSSFGEFHERDAMLEQI